jgi:hypothetical protein
MVDTAHYEADAAVYLRIVISPPSTPCDFMTFQTGLVPQDAVSRCPTWAITVQTVPRPAFRVPGRSV